MELTNIKLFFIALALTFISGCYHMRISTEPLPVVTITTTKNSSTALRIIRRVLDEEFNLRILEELNNGQTLISSPRHFATETGFGQPAGGRRYLLQLRIEIKPSEDKNIITLSPYHYELRTSYAYGLEGKVKTLYKIYPYDEYPGMFELSYLETEMKDLANYLEYALKDIQ